MNSPGTRADAELVEAEAHLEAGRSAAAVALFEKHAEGALAGRALLGLARCAVDVEHFHRALLHLQALEDLEPNNTVVHHVMGAALVGIGLLERAREELDKAVSADPKDIDSWRALAQLLDDLDDVPARVRAYERLLALAPGDGDATRWLAAARADAAGAHTDLLDEPREAPPPATVSSVDNNATPSEAARDLDSADIELEAGRLAEAARLYCRHLESELAPRALLGIARAERGQGHAHQALSHLQTLEQRQPDHPGLAGVMASVSYDLGCFDDAGEHFEHAIAQAPNDQKLWREYASFLQSTGDFKRIVEACQKVLQSSPERASVAPPSSLATVTGRSPGVASQHGSGFTSQRDGGQVVAPGLAGALAGGVAHTMNGVLTTIMGIASVLEQEMAPNDPKVSDVGDIITACQHGRTLTRRLLDFSRHSNMRREPVALNGIVEGVATLLARTTPPRITTSLKLDDAGPTTHGDPAALAHALQQICANAIESMTDGGTLSITTSWERVGRDESGDHPTELPPARYACIRVNDTGCGMAQETLERCFDPLFTTKPDSKKAGLGLSVVRGTAANHHGIVTIDSTQELGSTVTLYLPALERRPTATGRERVVLLVEDEPLARNAAKRQLKSLGFHVLEARDGREALSLYRERKGEITLVLLDLVMPKMDGEAVLDQLLKLDPNVKVLITSGYRSRDGARHLIERGAKGFLEKPYMFAELRQAIELAEG